MSNNEPDYADNLYFDENKKTDYYSIIKEYEDYGVPLPELEVTTSMVYSIEILEGLLKECKEVIKNVDTYYGNYDATNGYLVINKIDEVLNAK